VNSQIKYSCIIPNRLHSYNNCAYVNHSLKRSSSGKNCSFTHTLTQQPVLPCDDPSIHKFTPISVFYTFSFPSICPPIILSIHTSFHPPSHPSVYLYNRPSIYPSLNASILPSRHMDSNIPGISRMLPHVLTSKPDFSKRVSYGISSASPARQTVGYVRRARQRKTVAMDALPSFWNVFVIQLI
jgi:hypothetical protein